MAGVPAASVNLRSDTQSLPTEAMREAMAHAELGDDSYREDPTVLELESHVAELLRMEAAMLVLSGTMANLVAAMTHCGRGDVVFLDAQAHVLINEAGGLSSIAGVTPRTVPSSRGHIDPSALGVLSEAPWLQQPRPRLVWIENSHNRAGGTVLAAEGVGAIVSIAEANGVATHVDGARLFNAAVSLGVEPADLVHGVDSVYVDLTKGLCCPLGALLAGSAEFIEQARRNRQMLGGGMRQAGVIAACGLYALTHLVDRLAEDHARARRLASALAAVDGFLVDENGVDTNIVFADVSMLGGTAQVIERLGASGVLVSGAPPNLVRFVTHHGIGDEAISHAVGACRALASARPAKTVQSGVGARRAQWDRKAGM